jgi:CelD/BcsL family acetyltransferase involved in cellulose biosynthesis
MSPDPAHRDPALRVEQLESLDEGSSEWTALARTSGNVFCTPEFLSTWWRWFGDDKSLRTYCVRERSGRVVGLLPLYEWRTRPVRALRFLGHGAGDQLGPLAGSADRAAVARTLLDLLADARAPILIGEQLPRDERWSALLGGARVSREGNPVLRFEQERWDDYLAAQSANLRQQIRRLERRLTKAHDVRYACPTTAAEFEAGLDALFALHRARWSHAGTNFSRRESFHREFARLARERGWARLWLLEIDRRAVAAWYGLRFGDWECYYQLGRDPRWDRASVGFVLLVHSMREALQDGMTEYRFLRGGESYKYRFASDDPGLESIVVARGRAGGAALAAVRAGLALRRAYRDRWPGSRGRVRPA